VIPLLRGMGAAPWLPVAAAAAAGVTLLLPGDPGPGAARAALLALGVGAAALLLRRRGAEAPAPRLRVLSRVGLARDAAVVLVELDGRPLLLGVGRDGVRLLAEEAWTGPEAGP
jgi:Flagellar biosynthesis protein, FliO